MASEMASKRPLAAFGDSDMDADAKRLKTETTVDDAEVSFEDGMDLLVQNALSNINDLMGQLDGGEDEADMSGVVPTTEPDAPAADTMDLDVGPAVAEALAAATAPTFLSDPNKFIRQSNLTTLGTLVCWKRECCDIVAKVADLMFTGNHITFVTITKTRGRYNSKTPGPQLKPYKIFASAPKQLGGNKEALFHEPSIIK